MSNAGMRTGRENRSTLPGMGRDRDDNPLSGRRGLEGNAAAFDMKSLDKHLEAASVHSIGLDGIYYADHLFIIVTT